MITLTLEEQTAALMVASQNLNIQKLSTPLNIELNTQFGVDIREAHNLKLNTFWKNLKTNL